MRFKLEESISTSRRSWRLDRLLFLRRRWLLPCLSRRSLPLPVILKRLAVDLCVFIFGMTNYPCLCLCLGFSQITYILPLRLTILHFGQRRLTEGVTFTTITP